MSFFDEGDVDVLGEPVQIASIEALVADLLANDGVVQDTAPFVQMLTAEGEGASGALASLQRGAFADLGLVPIVSNYSPGFHKDFAKKWFLAYSDQKRVYFDKERSTAHLLRHFDESKAGGLATMRATREGQALLASTAPPSMVRVLPGDPLAIEGFWVRASWAPSRKVDVERYPGLEAVKGPKADVGFNRLMLDKEGRRVAEANCRVLERAKGRLVLALDTPVTDVSDGEKVQRVVLGETYGGAVLGRRKEQLRGALVFGKGLQKMADYVVPSVEEALAQVPLGSAGNAADLRSLARGLLPGFEYSPGSRGALVAHLASWAAKRPADAEEQGPLDASGERRLTDFLSHVAAHLERVMQPPAAMAHVAASDQTTDVRGKQAEALDIVAIRSPVQAPYVVRWGRGFTVMGGGEGVEYEPHAGVIAATTEVEAWRRRRASGQAAALHARLSAAVEAHESGRKDRLARLLGVGLLPPELVRPPAVYASLELAEALDHLDNVVVGEDVEMVPEQGVAGGIEEELVADALETTSRRVAGAVFGAENVDLDAVVRCLTTVATFMAEQKVLVTAAAANVERPANSWSLSPPAGFLLSQRAYAAMLTYAGNDDAVLREQGAWVLYYAAATAIELITLRMFSSGSNVSARVRQARFAIERLYQGMDQQRLQVCFEEVSRYGVLVRSIASGDGAGIGKAGLQPARYSLDHWPAFRPTHASRLPFLQQLEAKVAGMPVATAAPGQIISALSLATYAYHGPRASGTGDAQSIQGVVVGRGPRARVHPPLPSHAVWRPDTLITQGKTVGVGPSPPPPQARARADKDGFQHIVALLGGRFRDLKHLQEEGVEPLFERSPLQAGVKQLLTSVPPSLLRHALSSFVERRGKVARAMEPLESFDVEGAVQVLLYAALRVVEADPSSAPDLEKELRFVSMGSEEMDAIFERMREDHIQKGTGYLHLLGREDQQAYVELVRARAARYEDIASLKDRSDEEANEAVPVGRDDQEQDDSP